MLLFGEKTRDGHTLRVVLGPETDFQLDLTGRAEVEITPLLVAMNGTQKVTVQISRCRSEIMTSRVMDSTQITHINSSAPDVHADPVPAIPRDPGAILPAQPNGTCEYCGRQDVELLRVPGVQICGDCTQIELGRLKIPGQKAKKETKK